MSKQKTRRSGAKNTGGKHSVTSKSRNHQPTSELAAMVAALTPLQNAVLMAVIKQCAQDPAHRCSVADLQHLEISGSDLATALAELQSSKLLVTADGDARHDRYWQINPHQQLVTGRVTAHADGFGFVLTGRDSEDVYLDEGQMQTVLHGDQVLVEEKYSKRQQRSYGELLAIVARGREQVVGRLVDSAVGLQLVADDPKMTTRFMVDQASSKGKTFEPGAIVVARVTRYPAAHEPPQVELIKQLDDSHLAGLATEMAIIEHDLPEAFSDAAIQQAKAYGDKINADKLQGRKDLRELPLVTIDGEDARDFDDAVFCHSSGKGWRLVVAIADVASYVTADSPLDVDALERGTSAYFPTRVVPMLPEQLSNGLCSLRPDEDRLALVCDMQLEADGETKRSRFYPAVIKSHARLTYQQAQQLLDGDTAADVSAEVLASLKKLHTVWELRQQLRSARGALDFDRVETGFSWAADGTIADIQPRERLTTHRLIEEAMITANVAAANYLLHHQQGALYRVHPAPSGDKLLDLEQFLRAQGIKPGWSGEPEPAEFSRLLKDCADRPDFDLIADMLLRAQSLAVYQPDNGGHFGLALQAYCHFTSPIRRYPDLQVHRAIYKTFKHYNLDTHAVDGGKPPDLTQLGTHCSYTERRAESASRDVEWRLKCDYMQQFVGKTFDGLVTGVKAFGLFIELDNLGISGLAHISNLGKDYFNFDEKQQALVSNSGKQFRLADRVKIKLLRVDIADRKIDFAVL